MKQYKFKTHGSEMLSAAIQKKLFALGYQWRLTRPDILRSTEEPYLYATSHATIEYGQDPEVFASNDTFEELCLNQFFALQPEDIKTDINLIDPADPVEKAFADLIAAYAERGDKIKQIAVVLDTEDAQ